MSRSQKSDIISFVCDKSLFSQWKLAFMINSPRRLLSFSRTSLIRLFVVFCFLAGAHLCAGRAAPSGQSPTSQQSATAAIGGTVRDAAGAPVGGATMQLEDKGSSKIVKTQTDARGAYVLRTDHAGTYKLRAGKPGWADTVADSIALSIGNERHVDLVMNLATSAGGTAGSSAASAKSSTGSMEFADEPNFTVAGITDWSDLGLHGSAASSRTSESLAKQTLSLKSSEPAGTLEGKADRQYDAALAFRAKGEFAQAREQVRKELGVADNAEGHRLLGELDEQMNDPLEAVLEYEKAARMDPSERNYFEWGTELLLHKAVQPAVEVFTTGADAHPNSSRMLAGLGAALYSKGSWEEAASRLCEASDLQPADPAPYLFLGKMEKTTPGPLPCSEQKLARFALDEPENALANYYYAISISKSAKGAGDQVAMKQAEALLEKAVKIDPKLGEAYLELGVLHSARGDFTRAIRDYTEAIVASPDLGEPHRQLGLAYQRTGEKAKAQEQFETYDRIEKAEAAERERQQGELRQFLIILKNHSAIAVPH
jgi:tetratricopeptide (TPR) repeat protein